MPRHCALVGREGMFRVVRWGQLRARQHGVEAECAVLGWLDLMCLLGSGFDADPLLPWAAALLASPRPRDPIERADALYEAAWEYIERIVADYRDGDGRPTTARMIVLLKDSRGLPRGPLAVDAWPGFGERLASALRRTFPAKASVVGDDALGELPARAARKAASHGLRGERAIWLFAVLAFVLGAGFDDDPLLPWIADTLAEGGDEDARIDGLFAAGAQKLRQWWQREGVVDDGASDTQDTMGSDHVRQR